jgi:hypothetical protein
MTSLMSPDTTSNLSPVSAREETDKAFDVVPATSVVPEAVMNLLSHVSAGQQYPLSASWSFSFCHRPPGVKGSSNNYAEQMKVIGTVDNVGVV